MSDKIPKPFHRTIKLLAEWDEDTFTQLYSFLKQRGPVISLHGLIDKAQEILPNLVPDDIDQILHGVFAICSFQAYMDYSTIELIDETFSADSLSHLGISKDHSGLVRTRIGAMVSLPVVAVSAKGREVLESHGKVYRESRIFTDIRPIYPVTASDLEKPDAAVIVHMLRIRHRTNGQDEDFYVALDEIDIGMLQDVLIRAEKKAAGLKNVMKSSGVSLLEE